MKQFEYKDINKELLKDIEDCADVDAVKKYLADKDFEISDENAAKLYDYVNGIHEMSDKEASQTSGGSCGGGGGNCD